MLMRNFMLGITHAVRDHSCFARHLLFLMQVDVMLCTLPDACNENRIPSFSLPLARIQKQKLRTPDADDSLETENETAAKEKREKTEVERRR
jgi:hypothetical protein